MKKKIGNQVRRLIIYYIKVIPYHHCIRQDLLIKLLYLDDILLERIPEALFIKLLYQGDT